jgi:hypothetical protein
MKNTKIKIINKTVISNGSCLEETYTVYINDELINSHTDTYYGDTARGYALDIFGEGIYEAEKIKTENEYSSFEEYKNAGWFYEVDRIVKRFLEIEGEKKGTINQGARGYTITITDQENYNNYTISQKDVKYYEKKTNKTGQELADLLASKTTYIATSYVTINL